MSNDIEDTIIKGMAEILWGSAWSDHVEETRCQSLSGCEITEVMPEIPEMVFRACERLAGRIEEASSNSLLSLVVAAARADGIITSTEDNVWDFIDEAYQERFGNCLMHMAMGSGVSWWDDHSRFHLTVPHCADSYHCELMSLAEETCEECAAGDNECKAENCGKPCSGSYCYDHANLR